MYLKRLELQNFRPYENFAIDFDKRLTMIDSETNITSILEGAAIALATMFVPLGGVKSIGINRGQARKYPVRISTDAVCDGQEIHWERALNSINGTTTTRDAKSIIDIATVYQERLRKGDKTLILPVFAYYGENRTWEYKHELHDNVLANTRINGYIDSLNGNPNIRLMMQWFLKMEILKYQNQDLGINAAIPELETVYTAMEVCFGRMSGLDYTKIKYNIGADGLELNYTGEPDGFRAMLDKLGYVPKEIIYLVGDIAYRMASLNPQLSYEICTKTDGVVLIDRLDLYLKPEARQRFLEILPVIFPKVQFIITRHS